MYARITGNEPRSSRRNSESHCFVGEVSSSTSKVSPSDGSDWGSEGLGRREERSFGGVDVGDEFLGRRNLGSQDLVSLESSMASMRGMIILRERSIATEEI